VGAHSCVKGDKITIMHSIITPIILFYNAETKKKKSHELVASHKLLLKILTKPKIAAQRQHSH